MKSRLQQILERGQKAITMEISPPHGTDFSHSLAVAKKFSPFVDAFNVTDNQRALMRMSSVACSAILLQNNLEPVCQVTCRDRNVLAIQSDVLGASGLGIKNILALTGDPIAAGDTPEAKGVFQFESVGLLSLLTKLGNGMDSNSLAMNSNPQFFLGGVVNPGGRSLDPQIRRMERKVKAGARFFQTQAVFDLQAMTTFMERSRSFGAKVLGTVLLVRSAKTARFLQDKVPGINVPDEMIKRLEGAANPSEEGLKIAAEMVQHFYQVCDGVHLIAMKAEEKFIEVLNMAGIKPRSEAVEER